MDFVVIHRFEKCQSVDQWDLRDASASKNFMLFLIFLVCGKFEISPFLSNSYNSSHHSIHPIDPIHLNFNFELGSFTILAMSQKLADGFKQKWTDSKLILRQLTWKIIQFLHIKKVACRNLFNLFTCRSLVKGKYRQD